jgi:hypothetical protein
MAARVKMLKLLQEMRSLAEITNRRPPGRAPAVFLMQLRSHLAHTTSATRRRSISIDNQSLPDIPHPVKITHLRTAPVGATALPAP